jgi:hypothetical protein
VSKTSEVFGPACGRGYNRVISSSLRILLAALVVLLACAGCDPRASGAPAPQKKRDKPDKPLNLLGDWTQHWKTVGHGSARLSYEAWFRDDGTCGAVSDSEVWRGTWTVRGRTLYVVETCGERTLAWDARLDGALAGVAAVTEDSDGGGAGKRAEVRFAPR